MNYYYRNGAYWAGITDDKIMKESIFDDNDPGIEEVLKQLLKGVAEGSSEQNLLVNDIVIEPKDMNIKMDEFIHSVNFVVRASENAVIIAKGGKIVEVVEQINTNKDKAAQSSYDRIIYKQSDKLEKIYCVIEQFMRCDFDDKI